MLSRRLAAALVALASLACPRRVTVAPSAGQSFTVFVADDLDLATVALQAAAVRQERQHRPCLWLVCGDVLGEQLWTELTDAEAQARLLDAAGVDAVLLGPEWLRLGETRCQAMAGNAKFYLLCANVTGYYGAAIGQELMVRTLRGGSGANRRIDVGVTGLWSDSTSVVLRQNEVEFGSPEFDGARVAKLLKMRVGLTCVLVRGGAAPAGFDLVAGTRAAVVGQVLSPSGDPAEFSAYDVVVENGVVSDVSRRDIRLADLQSDAGTAAALDSLRRVVDSLAATVVIESQVTAPPAALGRAIVKELLAQRIAERFIYDVLVHDSVKPGIATMRRMAELLSYPGRLAILELEGRELKELARDRSVVVEATRAAKSQPLAMNRRYSVAATPDFVARRAELAGKRFKLTEERFIRLAADALKRSGGGR